MSQREMREHDVLENDVFIEDIERYALASGFSDVWAELSFVDGRIRLTPEQIGKISRGHRVPPVRTMWAFHRLALQTLSNQQFFYLAKGPLIVDSRWAEALGHRIRLLAVPSEVLRNSTFEVHIQIENTGQATWLCGKKADVGNVNLAVRRRPDSTIGELLEFQRVTLPKPLAPG